MKKEIKKPTFSLSDMPVLIIVVVVIIGLGTSLGLFGYTIYKFSDITNPATNQQTVIKKSVVDGGYIGNEFIQVRHPQKNSVIKNPVLISGKANVYEANVRVRILDDNKNILADDFITANGWMDKLYPFEKEINYDMSRTENGLIEIFEESARNGNDIHKVEIPVVFEDYEDTFSDWKVYRNEEFGFEMKYPRYFGISEKNNTISLINFYDSSQKIEILKSFGPPPETMRMKLIEIKKISINGHETDRELFQGKFDNNKNEYYLRVFISSKGIFYHADFRKENLESLPIVFDQILSTFKFIEEDETANWQTYRNEEYGFELKYPGDWDNPLWQENEYRKGIIFGCPVFDFEGNEYCPLFLSISEVITKNEAIRNISVGAYKEGDVIINEGNILTIKEFTVDTREAITYHGAGICVEAYTKIFDSKMTVSFTDRCSVYEGKIFDQILSTFKFIEKDEIKN